MSVEITHVRLDGNAVDENAIVRYKWRGEQSGEVGESDKPTMVAWLDNGGVAWVGSNPRARAVAVHPLGEAAYVRTVADQAYTNNLLELDRF